MAIHGEWLSMESGTPRTVRGLSKYGVRRYSDIGGWYSSGYPWMVRGLSE